MSADGLAVPDAEDDIGTEASPTPSGPPARREELEISRGLEELRRHGLSDLQIEALIKQELRTRLEGGPGVDGRGPGALRVTEQYVGPAELHPAIASKMESLCPGYTDRTLTIREQNAAAARQRGVEEDAARGRGQLFALLVALGVMAVAVIALFLNHPWVAGAVLMGEVGAIVYAFTVSRGGGPRRALDRARGDYQQPPEEHPSEDD